MSGFFVAITISIDRALLLTKKPLYQGFLVDELKSSLNQKTDIETGRELNLGDHGR
jgi:hypothetical protein